MGVYRHPEPGDLLMCDFTTGFREPEMIKKRPVVIISPRPRRATQLCTVVPISTSPPYPVLPCHHCLDPASVPEVFRENANWAKCDMLYTVSLDRLDRIKCGRDKEGKRIYVVYRITEDDLASIRLAVTRGLGL